MDRLIYVTMSGAKHSLEQQGVNAYNMANSATTGFRAEVSAFRAVPVPGDGLPTRTFVQSATAGSNLTPASLTPTGRDLDVAVEGQGWIALQLEDDSEAYTRNGNLQIGQNGLLQTRSGLNVQGDGGSIAIPPGASVTIARDGTVSTVPAGSAPNAVTTLGRIKLVNPEPAQLAKGDDGLFRLKNGTAAEASSDVVLVAGTLESSNVNMVEEMVNMIELARQYDMQMKLLQNAENNERQASQILNLRA